MSDSILSITSCGTAKHPRFKITDPQHKFWTGKDWTDIESEGRLYASINDAAKAIQELLLAEHGHKTMRRFVAPVYVDLYADEELTWDAVTDWLVRVARLSIDSETHGNGPVIGTLGLCHIDWGQLQEIKAAEN